MNTAITIAKPTASVRAVQPGAAAFGLFVVLNAVLFVRPAEILSALEGLPIYEILIVLCLIAAQSRLARQLNSRAIVAQPIMACVLAMLLAVVCSHLSHFRIGDAAHGALIFVKIVLYFLLLVTVVNTPRRLRKFCLFLVAFIAVATLLALFQYHGIINIASMEAVRENEYDPNSGATSSFYRLCSTGIFNDPNDLCLILVVGVSLALYFFTDPRERLRRALWAAAAVVFVYALLLTRSRGGLLALFASLAALFFLRCGLWKTILLCAIVIPALSMFEGNRQTNLDLEGGSGQQRIRLWSDGLMLLKTAPLFGIGMGQYVQELGLVAHNSYIHAYTELGLLGGTMFVGAFYAAMRSIYVLRPVESAKERTNSSILRLGPFLLAALAGYCVGIFSLSRVYVIPTYLMLGLVAVYINVAPHQGLPLPRFRARFLIIMTAVGAILLVATHLFIQVAVRRS